MFRFLLGTLLVVLVAIVFALFLDCEIPEGVDDVAEARFAAVSTHAVHKFAEYVSLLGLADELRINKWFTEKFSSLFRGKDDPLIQIEPFTMAGTPVVIYHYMGADNPKKYGLAPAVIFIHGGGWAVLNTDYYHLTLQRLVRKTKLMFISIEYKLVPDSLFPGPVIENADVVKYFLKNAHKFGNDKNSVVMIGDSAGGNLVAAVNILLRDQKIQPQPVAQVLVYPYLQLLDTALPSYQNGTVIVTRKENCVNYGLWYLFGHNRYKDLVVRNEHVSSKVLEKHGHKIAHNRLPARYFPKHYQPQNRSQHRGISKEFDDLVTNPLFSPLMADDLSGLPQTYIQTCQYDILRDDGLLFAHRLKEAKVNVKFTNYEASFHGAFLNDPMFVEDIAIYIDDVL